MRVSRNGGSWAIDLGTTNSVVARWDPAAGQPDTIALPGICRRPHDSLAHMNIPTLVPSSVFFETHRRFIDRLGSRSFFRRRFFWGREATIGQPAIDRWVERGSTAFVPVFKPYLGRESLRVLARTGDRRYTARQTASAFLRELFAAVTQLTGDRPRDVVFTTPVDSYEPYRAELKSIAAQLGIRRFRTLDEPVAASLGYGLGHRDRSNVLAINFGGGTLDVALIDLDRETVAQGGCRVLAKDGRNLGGRLVDAWLVEEFCKRLGFDFRSKGLDWSSPAHRARIEWWYQALLREACRVKEALYTRTTERFLLMPPEDLRLALTQQDCTELDFTRVELVELLTRNGLYSTIDRLFESVFQQSVAAGVTESKVDDVIMVGGSTLLPDVYARVAARFGRERIRAWQPFEAVAAGGCVFAAGAFTRSDTILHDYAFVTHHRQTCLPEYQVVVKRGTNAPSQPAIWKRQLTPTCPLGEPERIFKLVICEVGRAAGDHNSFVWDAEGGLHSLGAGRPDETIIVPLNESNPAMGYLNPPHDPREKAPRLEISFAVDADRWLTATVLDLRTRKLLMDDEPVVRLQ